ncbi:MAG: hypothetical protein V1776_03210 [Candidatus Diapherotrites archaeon]
MKPKITRWLLVLGITFLMTLPFVFSNFYLGNDFPFMWKNNYIGGDGNASLLAYGDENGGCFDTDNGFNPFAKGTMTWTDPTDQNTYVYSDFCDTNTTLIELGCTRDFKINGKQYYNYIIAAKYNCNDINAQSYCNPIAAKCG